MLADVACDGEPRLLRDRQAGRHAPDDDRRHELDGTGRRRHDAADERHRVPERRHVLRGRQRRHDPQDDERRPDVARRRRAARRQNLNGISCVRRRRASRSARSPAVRRPSASRPTARRGTRPGHRHEARSTASSCSSATACLAVGAAGTAIVGHARRRRDVGSVDERHDGRAQRGRLPAPAPATRSARRRRRRKFLKSTDGGTTWAPQTSNTTQRAQRHRVRQRRVLLRDGTVGTIVATADGGTTWAQQGNPISGPTTAINATNIALQRRGLHDGPLPRRPGRPGRHPDDAAADGHRARDRRLRHDAQPQRARARATRRSRTRPSGEAANVTGHARPAARRPSTRARSARTRSASCSGLADDGFNVVYDYAGSSDYTVTKAPLTVTADDQSRLFGAGEPAADGDAQRLRARTDARDVGRDGHGGLHDDRDARSARPAAYPITCTLGTLASANYSFGPFVPGTLTVTYSQPCITGDTSTADHGEPRAGDLHRLRAPRSAAPITVQPGGALDLEGGDHHRVDQVDRRGRPPHVRRRTMTGADHDQRQHRPRADRRRRGHRAVRRQHDHRPGRRSPATAAASSSTATRHRLPHDHRQHRARSRRRTPARCTRPATRSPASRSSELTQERPRGAVRARPAPLTPRPRSREVDPAVGAPPRRTRS